MIFVFINFYFSPHTIVPFPYYSCLLLAKLFTITLLLCLPFYSLVFIKCAPVRLLGSTQCSRAVKFSITPIRTLLFISFLGALAVDQNSSDILIFFFLYYLSQIIIEYLHGGKIGSTMWCCS